MGGLRYLVGDPTGPPARAGIALGDYAGAFTGAIGVLLALYERDRVGGSGRGQWIDNALYEAVLRLTEYTIPAFQHLGKIRERVGAGSAGTVPARAFAAKDGKWIGLSAANDEIFLALCAAMRDHAFAQDPRFATNATRIEHSEEVNKRIAEWAAQLDSAAMLELLRQHEVPAFPVYSAEDIVADPHIRARQAIADVLDPALGSTAMPNIVPRLSRTPGHLRSAGPTLGSHNEAVYLVELGMSAAELEELRDDGVV
jgi:formyl-CoA transferase